MNAPEGVVSCLCSRDEMTAIDMQDGYRSRIVRTESELEALKAPWDALNDQTGPAGVFTQHTAMMLNWFRHRDDEGKRLFVVCIMHGTRLIFAAPMFLQRNRFGIGVLYCLNSKTPLYNDFLIDPNADFEAVIRVFAAQIRKLPAVRKFKADFVREGSALARVMSALGANSQEVITASRLDTSGFSSWETFLQEQSSNARQQYRRNLRRLSDCGDIRIRRITDPSSLARENAIIFERKRDWLEEKFGKEGWVTPPETEAWFRDLAVSASASGQAYIDTIYCGTNWVAGCLSFERAGAVFISKFAHNPTFDRYKPGIIVLMEVLRQSIENRMKNIDFMIGRNEWKDRLKSHDVRILNIRLQLLGSRWRDLRTQTGQK